MNLASRDYQEKRNFIRMKVETPVHINIGDCALKGMCHNLSGGGLLISTEETIPLGAEIQIAVTSAHGHNPMLQARAKVSRVLSQPGAIESKCFVGLEILNIIG